MIPDALPEASIRVSACIDHGDHFRCTQIADMAHIRAEISRPDEHRIHAVNRQNIVKCFEAGAAFNLRHKAHLIICRLRIIDDAGEAAGARLSRQPREPRAVDTAWLAPAFQPDRHFRPLVQSTSDIQCRAPV